MRKKICPKCGCSIGEESYTKGGMIYCCEPCANDSDCRCSCCHMRTTNMPDSNESVGEGEPG